MAFFPYFDTFTHLALQFADDDDAVHFNLIESMSYDWSERSLVFSDTKQKQIFKMRIDKYAAGNNPTKLISLHNEQCNGVAIDACGR